MKFTNVTIFSLVFLVIVWSTNAADTESDNDQESPNEDIKNNEESDANEPQPSEEQEKKEEKPDEQSPDREGEPERPDEEAKGDQAEETKDNEAGEQSKDVQAEGPDDLDVIIKIDDPIYMEADLISDEIRDYLKNGYPWTGTVVVPYV